MAKIQNTKWREIGRALRSYAIHNGRRYLTQQRFERHHFLQAVTPYNEKFFGTKTYTVIIIAKAYDWEDEELLAGLAESKVIIKRNFYKFPHYFVRFYTDFVLVEMLEKATQGTGGGSSYRQTMETNEEKIIELCEEMADFGFDYGGRLEGQVSADNFKPELDYFYGLKESEMI